MEFKTNAPFYATATTLAPNAIRHFKIVGRMTGAQDEYQVLNEVRRNVAQGHSRFVFDFSQLEYANSCGIGVLIACVTTIRQEGGQVAAVNVPQRERDVLRICSFFMLCEEYDNLVALYASNAYSAV